MAEQEIEEVSVETIEDAGKTPKGEEEIETVSIPTVPVPDYQYGQSQNTLDYQLAVRNKPANPVFGDGSDGDLFVGAGETVTLAPGQYSYRRIQIDVGGTLKPASFGDFSIKANAEVRIDGTVDFSKFSFGFVSAQSSIDTAFGSILSGKSGNGGDGGWTGFGAYQRLGGTGQNGYGGGWAGGYAYNAPTYLQWGAAGNGWPGWSGTEGIWPNYLNRTSATETYVGVSATGLWAGGAGGAGWTSATFTVLTPGNWGYSREWHAGTPGAAWFVSIWYSGFPSPSGGGGGGGSPGKNGCNLVIYANSISGTGTITTDGENGYSGGAGWAGGWYAWETGAAGGGGGGWMAGALAVYYSGDVSGLTITNVPGTGWTGYASGADGTAGAKKIVDVNSL